MARLQLGLNGWPPYASHLLCFFLGVMTVTASQRERPPVPVPGRRAAFVRPAGGSPLLRLAGNGSNRLWFFVGRIPGGDCRLHGTAMRLHRAGEQVLVEVDLDDLRLVRMQRLLRGKEPGRLRSPGKEVLPLCGATGRVSYGSL